MHICLFVQVPTEVRKVEDIVGFPGDGVTDCCEVIHVGYGNYFKRACVFNH